LAAARISIGGEITGQKSNLCSKTTLPMKKGGRRPKDLPSRPLHERIHVLGVVNSADEL